MGHRYFLYPYQGRRPVPVHDPGSVRQQYRGLQDGDAADSQPCPGYDSAGNEEGEKESRCGVAAPQRPRLSIYIASIF